MKEMPTKSTTTKTVDSKHPIDDAQPTSELELIHQRLLAPFPVSEMECRPGATFSGKAKPLFYVDPRAYAKRLNQVLGIDGWSVITQDLVMGAETTEQTRWDFQTKSRIKEGTKSGLLVGVVVEIQVHTKHLKKTVSDVGEKGVEAASENKLTSAFAQAFKRAATHLGVGAYLYYIGIEPQPYSKDSGFPFNSPPDDKMEEALRDIGFKSTCEITGKRVRWKVAAYSMHHFGKILCEEECEKLRPVETEPSLDPE